MPNYLVIENNIIKNIVVAEPEYAAQQGWSPAPDDAGIGFMFNGAIWVNPNPPTLEELAAGVRSQRDLLLSATDWAQAADVPQATKDKWAPYRQALRDISAQAGFPATVVWPTKP